MHETRFRQIVKEEIGHEIALNNKVIFAEIDDKFRVFKVEFKSEIVNEFNRSIGMIKEQFVSEVRFMAEQIQGINEKITDQRDIKKVVDNHEHRLSKAGL